MNHHPYIPLVYQGHVVLIDAALAPLMQALWDLGIETSFCCQGDFVHPEDGTISYISFPRLEDHLRFVLLAQLAGMYVTISNVCKVNFPLEDVPRLVEFLAHSEAQDLMRRTTVQIEAPE